LMLKIKNYKDRKFEIGKFKNSECICVEGYVKEDKNCLILLHPPMMKNGFVYQGLKPVVMVYEGQGLIKEENEKLTQISSSINNNCDATNINSSQLIEIKNTNPEANQYLNHFQSNSLSKSYSNLNSNVNSNNNSFINNSSGRKINSIPNSQRVYINKKSSEKVLK
jgi:hypothetical protein